MFIGEGGCDAVSFFLCKKLGNRLFGAFLVHFFGHKKVSQVYFTITYETISAERKGFEPLIPFWSIHTFQACLFNHSSTSPF